MKIVFLSDDFPPQSFGGAGISTYELAFSLERSGHEIVVITTCREESEAGESTYHGLKIFKVVSNYPNRWRSYLSLYNRPVVRVVEEIIKKIKPDVVHANNIHLHLSYYCLKIAKKHAKVVIWTARDVMAFNYGKLMTKQYLENFDCRTTWYDHLKQARKRWNPLRNFFIRRYLGYADKLFAVSNALKIALKQNGIKNVEVIHTGADPNSWIIDENKTTRLRKKYHLENKKVVLFGGRLSWAKGGKKAIEAMATVIKEIPDSVLLIVGRIDAYADQMKNEGSKLGISDRLIFTGWIERDEIRYTYACVDVVLVPSICFDAFPRVILEAMASRKPVVATCYGGAPELVEEGVTGHIVNPFIVREMAEKIIDLLKNDKKAEKFGEAGWRKIETSFNLNEKSKQIINCYKNICASNK